ncbi:MAG: two component transcriptional regulator LuxR family [Spirochaetes bacterium]|nr:MAG: two component transcriptional regulator LuxR family [Spirochaetota bacterium]
MLNILIADDHFLVRKGLRQLLEENLPLAAMDEAEDGIQALEKARKRHFDLIILDYSMPGKEGLDLVRDMKDLDPTTHILILSILPEEQYALRAFRAAGSEEPHVRLSDREFQILKLLALGKSVGEIAELLSLSVKTVSTYRGRVLEKMSLENNAQLMNYAFKKGLVGYDR